MFFFFKVDYIIKNHVWVLKIEFNSAYAVICIRKSILLCSGLVGQQIGAFLAKDQRREIVSIYSREYRYYLSGLERHWQEMDDGMTFFFCLSHVEKLGLPLCCVNKLLSQNLSSLEAPKWLKTHQWHPNSHVCK